MAVHRLAAVVRLRERGEKDALEALGAAVRGVERARLAVEEARHRALSDRRQSAEVRSWELAEDDHLLALRAVKVAEEQLGAARRREEECRARHLLAYREAEVVRRLAAAREVEARSEADKRENKMLDEIASQRSLRRRREDEGGS
jgi:flagellar biosynthesis chaperone FliJ